MVSAGQLRRELEEEERKRRGVESAVSPPPVPLASSGGSGATAAGGGKKRVAIQVVDEDEEEEEDEDDALAALAAMGEEGGGEERGLASDDRSNAPGGASAGTFRRVPIQIDDDDDDDDDSDGDSDTPSPAGRARAGDPSLARQQETDQAAATQDPLFHPTVGYTRPSNASTAAARDDASLLKVAGSAALQRGAVEEARTDYQDALAMHGGLVAARTNLALVCLRSDQPAQAREQAALALLSLGWRAEHTPPSSAADALHRIGEAGAARGVDWREMAGSCVDAGACKDAGVADEEAGEGGQSTAAAESVGAKLACRALVRRAHALEQEGEAVAAVWAAAQACGVRGAPDAVLGKAQQEASRLASVALATARQAGG